MQLSEHGDFRAELDRLAAVFERTVDDVLVDAYWQALRDVPLLVLRERASRHIREGKRFPQPRDLRHNPDGERRAADTRSPDAGVDGWQATLNRLLLAVLSARRGVSKDALGGLVAEKNRLAASMQAAQPTPAEWAEMAPRVLARLEDLAR